MKTRSDSKWFSLSKSKLTQLESWLFDDHLSYDDALARAKAELGFTGSKSSLQRFYRRTAQQRSLDELLLTNRDATQVASAPASPDTFLFSGIKLLSQSFFQQAQAGSEADIPALAKILLLNQLNQIKNEDNHIKHQNYLLRRQRLDFEKERWQFDLIEEALKSLPQLNQIQRERDHKTDPFSGNKVLNEIRRRLFGEAPKNPLPENEEQKRELEKAREREEAERQRRYEESLAKEREAAERRRQAEQARRQSEQATQTPSTPAPIPWRDSEPENRYPFNDPATAARWDQLLRKSRKFA